MVTHSSVEEEFGEMSTMILYCENRATIKEKLDFVQACTPYVSSSNQLKNMLTKGLFSANFQQIISELGMQKIFASA